MIAQRGKSSVFLLSNHLKMFQCAHNHRFLFRRTLWHLGFSDWDSVKPEDFEAIRQNDTEFVTSEEFSKIKWIVNEHEDIYVPDYTDVLRVAFTFKFLRGRISDLASLLSGRDFDTCDYQKAIAENSFAKLKEGVLEFVSKTDFQRYLMIVKSTGIISPATIRSQNVLNFGYALYLLLRSKGEDAAIIEKVVRWWMVLIHSNPEDILNLHNLLSTMISSGFKPTIL